MPDICFPIPSIIFAGFACFFSCSLPRHNSDPVGSLGRLFFPLPAMVRAFVFHREKSSALSSLVDSPRIVQLYVVINVGRSYYAFVRSCAVTFLARTREQIHLEHLLISLRPPCFPVS